MTAKEYLLSVKGISKSIVALNEELKVIKSRKDGLNSIQISEKVKSSITYSNLVDELIDQEETVIRERKGLHTEWWACRQYINQISNSDYRDVLRYYYLLNAKTWEVVAQKMHISERRVYIIHGYALEEFRKITNFP